MALELARRGKAFAGPNPAVGAVIVKDNRVVSTGYYMGPGTLHAEAEAIRVAGKHAVGATMFVTLEPHCYHGTQPPCTDKIIEAGISRVVIAAIDPNPKVNGKGVRQLTEAGLQVEVGLMETEAKALNKGFFKAHQMGLPYLRLKLALSLDGFVADATGKSKWISGPQAREYVHKLRGEMTSVMVGVGTVLADDPLLTPRLVYAPRKPTRFVLDTRLRIPLGAKVLNNDAETVVVTGKHPDPEKLKAIRDMGHQVWVLEKPGWEALFKRMVKEDHNEVMFEGGAQIARSLISSGYLDELLLIYGPVHLGKGLSPFPGQSSLETAKRFYLLELKQLGQDVLMRFALKQTRENKGEKDERSQERTLG